MTTPTSLIDRPLVGVLYSCTACPLPAKVSSGWVSRMGEPSTSPILRYNLFDYGMLLYVSLVLRLTAITVTTLSCSFTR